MKHGTAGRFVNADVDVRTKRDLTLLLRALEPGAWVIHSVTTPMTTREHYCASLELCTQPNEPDAAIRSFVRLIEHLPFKARAAWNRAVRRDFSVGVDVGSTPSSFEVALTPEVLKLAAAVDARIVFVVHVAEPPVASSR